MIKKSISLLGIYFSKMELFKMHYKLLTKDKLILMIHKCILLEVKQIFCLAIL